MNSENTRRAEIIQSCQALFAPGQVAEVRILGIQGSKGYRFNASGWFNEWDKLADCALKYEQRMPTGIYVTINPVKPACLARASNRIVEGQRETTCDRDIMERHWIPIDLDPIRPSGVSASQQELEDARISAIAIISELEDKYGFTKSLRAASGNGIHLLYRIDVPNDDKMQILIRSFLLSARERFSTATVVVDTSLFNPSRILKLWGTATRKGEHTEERPHRLSKLWTPTQFLDVQPVHLDVIRQFVAENTPAELKRSAIKTKSAVLSGEFKGAILFDLDEFIRDNHIAIKHAKVFDGTGTVYVLEHCLFDNSHVKTSACLGRAPSGNIFYKCQHDTCSSRTWKDVKALYADATQAANRKISDDEEAAVTCWPIANAFVKELFTDDDLDKVSLRRHRESYYVYSCVSKCYEPRSNDWMKIMLTRWLGENGLRATTRMVIDVQNCVNAMVAVPEYVELPVFSWFVSETNSVSTDTKRRNCIALANGILDIERVISGDTFEDCLLPSTSDWLSPVALPFSFPTSSEQYECPNWFNFLAEVLGSDAERIAITQEMFGYCFFQDTRFERFFILHGRGNNGKSTVLDVLLKLLGRGNVTSLSLEQVCDMRLRAELYLKVANICSDLPEIDKVEEGLLKRITSGEAIVADRKYKDPIRFSPFAKLIFSTNTLPRFADVTFGVWRRMIVIPFNYTVPPEDVDVHLGKKLEHELPGIFTWALEGASRLNAQNGFSASQVCEYANRTYRMSCFPVLTFMEECTEPRGKIHVGTLWEAYRRWCNASGLSKPKPVHAFLHDVLDFYPNVEHQRVSSKMAIAIELFGLQLRPDLDITTLGRVAAPDQQYW
jgi:P4 family phage/plasmid primase-like protien